MESTPSPAKNPPGETANQDPGALFKEFSSSPGGLTNAEANKRLEKYVATHIAPWYVVPADDKDNARIIISQVVLDTLDGLKMGYPKPDKAQRKELERIRKLLEK